MALPLFEADKSSSSLVRLSADDPLRLPLEDMSLSFNGDDDRLKSLCLIQ